VAAELGGSPPQAAQPPAPAGAAGPGPGSARQEPPDPLPGYQILEVAIGEDSSAAGKTLASIAWPPDCSPVSVLRNRKLRDADPHITLAPGDRVNLLARLLRHPPPQHPHGKPPDSHAPGGPPASQPPAPTPSEQP
jgi:hypothetical protein